MRLFATVLAALSLVCWQADATVLSITSPTGFPATGITGTTSSTTLTTTAGTFSGTPGNGTIITGTGLAASDPWNYLTGCSGTAPNLTCTINGPADTPCASACTINLFYGYQIPANWVNAGSTIEAEGAGGYGHNGSSSTVGGGGGGGGVYVKSNPTSGYTLTAGRYYPYSIGPAGGATATVGETFFNGTSSTVASAGAYGGGPGAASGTGGAGGITGNSICTGTSCIKFAGGTGGAGGSAGGGGGGGGGGGPHAAGVVGVAGAATTGGGGGQGDSTFGGTGGAGATSSSACTAGNPGSEFSSGVVGAGGGGGGGAPVNVAGCVAGAYGGGGGAPYGTGSSMNGTQGGIWITYTPSATSGMCFILVRGTC